MQAANPGTTEKIVVIGPSMGGQIARYALAYMEHNNLPHNTRLFISLDSPNNGATIPIGLQHFVKYFADETQDSKAVQNLAVLNSPTSRELAQHHFEQGTYFLPDPARTDFVNTLSSWGNYPSQLRRVAVADGAIDGTPQHDQYGQVIQAGQQAFGFEQRGIPPGGIISSFIRVSVSNTLLARTITTASARVWYAPGDGQNQQVLAFLQNRIYSVAIIMRTANGPAGSCGLDGAPGGYRNFFSFALEDRDKDFLSPVYSSRNYYSVRDKACFIPTMSALGYNQPVDNCQAAGQNLVCAGTTPFDAYYGPVGHNDEHVQLTSGNVEFMRNEILRITPTPTFTTAPTVVCPGRNGRFQP